MKVIQINCSSFGSTGNIAKLIHNKLIEQKDESYIFYGSGVSTDANIIKTSKTSMGVRIHALLSKILGNQGYYSRYSTKKLIKNIKKIKPDVIHLHNLHGSYLNIKKLLKFLKNYKTPVVLTLHDCWTMTGKCYHFYEVKCDKWKTQCYNCPQLSMYPKSLYFDRTKKMYKDKKIGFEEIENLTVVAVSKWLEGIAKQSYLKDKNILTIYNGIDTNIFYPRDDINFIDEKYGLREKFVILGVASVWTPQRGLNEFIKIAKRLDETHKIVLVGLSKEQATNLPENIIAVPRTESKEELASLYSRANVFVNLSTEETFGLVTAEAMACGTPVIVCNSTANPELVGDGTGFVAEPHNVDKVCEYIEEIKSNQRDYKNTCVAHANKNYKKEKMVEEYMLLYENLTKTVG